MNADVADMLRGLVGGEGEGWEGGTAGKAAETPHPRRRTSPMWAVDLWGCFVG